MKNKYFYPIFKLKAKSWIRYWLLKKTEFKGKLSEILSGFTFNLQNTLRQKFIKFDLEGHSEQETTSIAGGDEYDSPSPDHEQAIISSGDNGSITEKIVNKNFLKVKPGTYQDSGHEITITVNEDGTIHVAGTTTSVKQIYIPLDSDLVLQPNDYCWSSKNTGILPGYSTTLRILTTNYAVDSNSFANTYLTIFKDNTNKKNTTITQKTTYKYFFIYTAANVTVDYTIQTQLEWGSIATDYVSHEEQTYTIPVQQPMRSIGDIRDCFVKVNGSWFERHYIKRLIFDGTENWQFDSSHYRFYILLSESQLSTNRNGKSNYFKIGNTETTNNCFSFSSTAVLFRVDETITSKADAKSWVATKYANGHPLYTDYILSEPTLLPCTQSQIDILENLPITYEGQTNIYSTDEVQPYLKIQYWESDENG